MKFHWLFVLLASLALLIGGCETPGADDDDTSVTDDDDVIGDDDDDDSVPDFSAVIHVSVPTSAMPGAFKLNGAIQDDCNGVNECDIFVTAAGAYNVRYECPSHEFIRKDVTITTDGEELDVEWQTNGWTDDVEPEWVPGEWGLAVNGTCYESESGFEFDLVTEVDGDEIVMSGLQQDVTLSSDEFYNIEDSGANIHGFISEDGYEVDVIYSNGTEITLICP